jgi:hypothetical protein
MAGSGIGHQAAAQGGLRYWVAQQTEWLHREIPYWHVWAVSTYDRRTLWSAGTTPDVAVISEMPSPDSLVKAVRRYEERLPEHIAEERRRLAAKPDTGIGRAEAAVLAQKIKALEALAVHLATPAEDNPT